MDFLATMLDDPVAFALALPPLALPLFVLLSAFLEHLVPPYWGDLFVLVGFYLAGQGAASLGVVFVLALTGSLLGIAVTYLLGRRYGGAVAKVAVVGPRLRRQANAAVSSLFERFGERVLVFNRFIPVGRGFFGYLAGGCGLRFDRTLWYSGLSSLLWTGFLMSIGFLATTWTQVERDLAGLGRTAAAIAVLGLGLVVVGGRARRMWREARSPVAAR